MTTTQIAPVTRVVERPTNTKEVSICEECDKPIKFNARKGTKRIIVNVYEDGQWVRMEMYHPDCYSIIGSPYGKPTPIDKQ